MAEFVNVADNLTNSSDYAFMNNSINHSKTNKFTLDSLSTFYKINDELTIGVYDILKKYEHILKSNIVEIEIPKDYLYRPEYVSKYYYNTTDLWYLIMFLNNIIDPMELNSTKVKVLSIDSIAILNEIYALEMERINNQDDPTPIESEIVKPLNKASEYVFKEDTTMYKPMIPPDTKRKSYSIKDFMSNFNNSSQDIIKRKMKKTFYNKIIDGTFQEEEVSICDNFNIDRVYKNGIPNNWNNNYKITYEGNIYSESDGIYSFKPLMIGDCNIFINNMKIKSFLYKDINNLNNIYSNINPNYDFNLGDDSDWTLYNGIIEQNSILNKKVLKYEAIDEDFDVKNIIATRLNNDEIDNTKDIIVKSKIRCINKNNFSFGSPIVTIMYDDGTCDEFKNNPSQYSNNTGDFVDIYVLCNVRYDKNISYVQIDYRVENAKDNQSNVNGILYISDLCVFQHNTEYINVFLKGDTWNTFKIEYINDINVFNYFEMYLRRVNETSYSLINDREISMNIDSTVNKEIKDSISTYVYTYDKLTILDKYLSNTLDCEDLNLIYGNKDVYIKKEGHVELLPNREYKLTCNPNDIVKVYINNNIWLQNNGKNEVTKLYQGQGNVKIKIEIYHKIPNGDIDFKIEQYPDMNGNSSFGIIDKSALSTVLEDSSWRAVGNIITLEKSSLGFTSYTSQDFELLDTYNIKCKLDLNDLNYNGSVGIVFRKKSENEFYLYMISKLNEKSIGTRSYLSGLYKVSKNASSQIISSDNLFTMNLELLSQTSQKYDESKDNLIYVNLNDNRIRIFNNYTGGTPVVDYIDNNEPYLEGNFGFAGFNIENVDFSEINVMYYPN